MNSTNLSLADLVLAGAIKMTPEVLVRLLNDCGGAKVPTETIEKQRIIKGERND